MHDSVTPESLPFPTAGGIIGPDQSKISLPEAHPGKVGRLEMDDEVRSINTIFWLLLAFAFSMLLVSVGAGWVFLEWSGFAGTGQFGPAWCCWAWGCCLPWGVSWALSSGWCGPRGIRSTSLPERRSGAAPRGTVVPHEKNLWNTKLGQPEGWPSFLVCASQGCEASGAILSFLAGGRPGSRPDGTPGSAVARVTSNDTSSMNQ